MHSSNKIYAKPFLKWAGGKGQLLNQIKEFLPSEFISSKTVDKYFEPFLGGGAVYFWLAQEYKINKAFLYDVNAEIITAYQVIQKSVESLITELRLLENEYKRRSKSGREEFFYSCRLNYNEFISKKIKNHVIRRSALMIFLNKTCFNGLFRVNSQGLFNVPFGKYENPRICDEQNLLAVHKVLQSARIECVDFSHCLDNAGKDSLVYFDPPYRPISKTASFTGYIKDGFNDSDHRRLKEICDKLTRRGTKVILSNSDPKNNNIEDNFFDNLFNRNYKIERLKATRMINCQAERRGMINEILVMNY